MFTYENVMNPNLEVVDHFINKFTAINEDLWCVGVMYEEDKKCALGWCECEAIVSDQGNSFPNPFSERWFLRDLMWMHLLVCTSDVNDGTHYSKKAGFDQDNPKARVLAALNQIKNKI